MEESEDKLVEFHTLAAEEDTIKIMGFRYDLHKQFLASLYISVGLTVLVMVLSLFTTKVDLVWGFGFAISPSFFTYAFLKIFIDNKGPNYFVDLIQEWKGVTYQIPNRSNGIRRESIVFELLEEEQL